MHPQNRSPGALAGALGAVAAQAQDRANTTPRIPHPQPAATEATAPHGSNRLPELAAQIRTAHAGVEAAAKVAGQALIEAKALLKHGEWLPWLKEHCGLSERTAQLYMKIVRLGFKSETVADIGLKAAAGAFAVIQDDSYYVWAGLSEEEIRQWLLFIAFGLHPAHVEWLRQKEFTTPDEWLGEEGAKYRRGWGVRGPGQGFLDDWAAFKQRHAATPIQEVERAAECMSAIHADHEAANSSRRRRRS